MRLSKKDREQLRAVLASLERAQRFIQSERVIVAVKSSMGSADVLTRPEVPGVCQALRASEINKHAGSDLTGLDMGINGLSMFLVMH